MKKVIFFFFLGNFYLDAVQLGLEVEGDPPGNISIVRGSRRLPQRQNVGVKRPLGISRSEDRVNVLLVLVSLYRSR